MKNKITIDNPYLNFMNLSIISFRGGVFIINYQLIFIWNDSDHLRTLID